jgi:HK97 family phage major capsid protein
MTEELKTLVTEIKSLHEELKSQDQKFLKKEDAVTKENMDKINKFMDEAEAKMENIAKSAARSNISQKEEKAQKEELQLKAFERYLNFGDNEKATNAVSTEEVKAFSISGGPDGGYLLQPELMGLIKGRVFESSPIRQLASVYTTGANEVDMPITTNTVDGGWTSETGARAVTNTNAPIGKVSISLEEVFAQPAVTQRFLDTVANGGSICFEMIAEKLALLENTAFISGTGAGQPQGILTAVGTVKTLTTADAYSASQVELYKSGANGTFTGDNLINFVGKLKDAYAANASWLMNRTTIAQLRTLKGTTNDSYLWQPSLTAGNPSILLGAPVYAAADVAVPATGSNSFIYGDFKKGYAIVDGTDIVVLRDPYSNKPYINFYTRKSVGGGVVTAEALKVLQLAA